ncbi:MAG: hypothetical protein KF752_09585 [Pirellulaceae bacterium]|nr:hypothetical protein [Pirellulaceae bacterium]
MTLISANLPLHQEQQLPLWLEQQLLSEHLGQLIAELEVLHATDHPLVEQSSQPQPATTLQQICGDQMSDVLQRGLTVLSDSQVRALLSHPAVLLELQEQVMTQGGSYWMQLKRDPQLLKDSRQSWSALANKISIAQPASIAIETASTTTAATDATLARSQSVPANRRAWMWALAGLAAAMLLAVSLWRGRTAGDAWGFQRSGLLAADLPAADYLESLADAAEDWFNKRPDDAVSLAQRIASFERGCDELLIAKHPQLDDVTRAWLVERCQLWKSKLIAQRTELESGASDVEQTIQAADQTIRTLQTALRDQAKQLSS